MEYDALGGFVLGGRYERFTHIPTRYPTDRAYRQRIAAGARYAASRRWILERDRRAYVRQATHLRLDTVACPPWSDG